MQATKEQFNSYVDFSKLISFLSVVFVIAAILHPNSGIIDKIYMGTYATVSLLLIVGKKGKQPFSIAVIHSCIAVILMLNVDKVTNYPDRKYEEIIILLFFALALLHIPIIHGFFSRTRRIYSLISLLVIYTPAINIPPNTIRQVVGYLLVNSNKPIYFTKIQKTNVYGVFLNDVRQPVYFPSLSGYEDINYAHFVDGDGSMGRQSISLGPTYIVMKYFYGKR